MGFPISDKKIIRNYIDIMFGFIWQFLSSLILLVILDLIILFRENYLEFNEKIYMLKWRNTRRDK